MGIALRVNGRRRLGIDQNTAHAPPRELYRQHKANRPTARN
jgi:hypothetical protein